MLIGVDYYPEHWEEQLWEKDISLMKEAGIGIVRVGEFGWGLMEKEKGRFDFSLFDKAIDKLGKNGIQVILGTPTATPPAWMCHEHTDILSEDEAGRTISFGGRRQYCFNSKTYHEFVKTIVEKMAHHFKDNPFVVGFQVDNELGHEESDKCYCENCRGAFATWLKSRYETLDRLNQTWGTVFWSQTYTAWEQIPLPKTARTAHNPSMELDYRRCMSDSIVLFSEMQVDILREILPPRMFVTTNNVACTSGKALDIYHLCDKLDFMSYDNYPVWGGLEQPVVPWETAINLDCMRGMKNKPFWVMEELAGAQGHRVMGYNPRPGQMKLWSYQAIARGAEALLYFRWRAAHFGAEQFCHGILDHDNVPRRKYAELKEMIRELKEYGEDLTKSQLSPQSAIIHDFENMWAWQIQPLSSALEYRAELQKFYRPLFENNVLTDVIHPGADLEKYSLVVAPIPYLFREQHLEKIKAYVENGGDLILTYRAGVKDENNLIRRTTLPGIFRELAGIRIEEYESLQRGQYSKLEGVDGALQGGAFTSEVWADRIECESATPLAVYKDAFYQGKAAVTMNRYGKGLVYYIGCSLDANGLDLLYRQIFNTAGIQWQSLDKDIEVVRRESEDSFYWFVMNHSCFEKTLGWDGENISLKAYDARILRKRKS